MFISPLIKSFVNEVIQNLDYNYIPKVFYDPNLDFDSRLRSFLVRHDAQKNQQEALINDFETTDEMDKVKEHFNDEDWVAIVWNRQGIQDAPEIQDRSFTILDVDKTNLIANKYTFKLAKISFEINFFSNSLSYLEDFEEEMFLKFNKLSQGIANLPVMGLVEVTFTELALSSISKLDRNDRGTIAFLPLSYNVIVPILSLNKNETNLPIIGEDINNTGKPRLNIDILFEVD